MPSQIDNKPPLQIGDRVFICPRGFYKKEKNLLDPLMIGQSAIITKITGLGINVDFISTKFRCEDVFFNLKGYIVSEKNGLSY